jgi:exopolysaccharide production protein ExoY
MSAKKKQIPLKYLLDATASGQATARAKTAVSTPRGRALCDGERAAKGQDAYWQERTVGGFAKRAFDVVAAGAALVFLAPLLVPVALLVRLHDGGPAVYRHKRIGRGGRAFECLKFRSMTCDADKVLAQHLRNNPAAALEWERGQKLRSDPRVTPVGRFLRATSLDELPQLFNVICGDMSLVGPRPVVADELNRYERARVHYLSARPGLTGLWQISGRNDTSYAQRVSLDKIYVTDWSLPRDIEIVLKTIPAVIAARGVY